MHGRDASPQQPKGLAGWRHEGDRIAKTFRFERFMDGIRFVREIAELAEAMDHHPDLHVGFRRVTVECTTHDAGRVTDKDLRLAEEADRLYTEHFMTEADGE